MLWHSRNQRIPPPGKPEQVRGASARDRNTQHTAHTKHTLHTQHAPAGKPEQVRWLLSEEAAAQKTGAVTGLNYKEAKSPVMVAVEEAEGALDMAAAGAVDGGYEAVRETVAAAYERAGLTDAANFIRAAS